MSDLETLPAAPDQQLEGVHGRELAEQLVQHDLAAVQTTSLGDYRAVIDGLDVRHSVELADDAEASRTVTELQDAISTVVTGHEHVRVNQTLAGTSTLGQNFGLSDDAEVSPDVVDPETLVHNTKHSLGVVLHEASRELGHAGQVQVQGLVDESGVFHSAEEILEGNVEQQVADHLGTGRREGQPQELYGNGEDFVRSVGTGTIQDYARKTGAHSGDAVWAQQQVFKNSGLSAEQKEQALQQTDFDAGEVDEIVGKKVA